MKISYLALILACLIGMTAQAEEQIYKWTDENGEVHFTSVPPPGAEAEQVVLPKNKLPTSAAAVSPGNNLNAAPEPPEPIIEKEGPTPAELKQQAKELCERGHFLVDSLTPRPQALLTAPDGTVRALSDTERQERIDRGHMLIKKYCNYRP